MPKTLTIVGGGISGLATAYYTQKNHPDLDITLIESSDQLGGKIVTAEENGFVIEGGPDSFISQKPWALQLARELGLDDKLIGTNDERRQTFILRNGKLHKMPDGLMLIVPTRFMPFVKSGLISWPGKLRMGMDLFIRPRQDDKDESLGQFIRRRLGREALDVLAEPMLAGIHVSDAETLSLMATFPRFRDIERKYGSLTRGMIAARKNRPPASSKTSMFMTFKGGLKILTAALEDAFQGEAITGHAVQSIESVDGGGYRLTLDDGRVHTTDTVILATPAYAAADMLRQQHPQLAEMLDGIRYVSTATVSLGYDKLSHPLNGFGFVIPRKEPTKLLACTWTSTKFDHRAPEGHALLRAFVGGPWHPEMVDHSDEELVAIVREELKKIMGIQETPITAQVFRWERSNPQYDVGHLERVDQMEALCPPGLYLTGSAYRGVGIPDCVHQGQQTAEKVTAYLAAPVEAAPIG